MVVEKTPDLLEDPGVWELGMSDLAEASALVRKVFLAYDAADCTEEGVGWFMDFMDETHLREQVREGLLRFYGLEEEGRLAAVGAVRGTHHLALLFVDTMAQGKGMGRRLLEELVRRVFQEEAVEQVTVNAAQVAVGFYGRQGFQVAGAVSVHCGIPYIPMVRRRSRPDGAEEHPAGPS